VDVVRVAVVNDFELIVAGVARLLEGCSGIEVAQRVVLGEPIDGQVDVALYDTYGRAGDATTAVRALAELPQVSRVALFSFSPDPGLIAECRSAGASGFISKDLPREQIVAALLQISAGESITATPSLRAQPDTLEWPGRRRGLTQRQSEVVALAADGLSNREIAASLFISTETVKDYLSQAFARLGVRNRVEVTNLVRRSDEFSRATPAR
jgi:DNA-binding NarL/FixJ family response regulator